MPKRTIDEVQLDLANNRAHLNRADAENVYAQYKARLAQIEVDRLKQRSQKLVDELADIRCNTETPKP